MSIETRLNADGIDRAEARIGLATRVGAMAFTLWRAYRGRRALRTLIEADDRMLRDIGVTRDDVRWALDAPATQDPTTYLRLRAVSRRAAERSELREAAAARTQAPAAIEPTPTRATCG